MRAYSVPQQEVVLKKALINTANLLAISRRELSSIIGVSEASLSRLYEGKKLIQSHTKEGELALILIRLYRSLDTLFGGNTAQCQLWFRSPNTHLAGIPAELVQTISGLMTVVIYLDAMRGKI